MSPFFYFLSLYLACCIAAGYSLRCHICESFGTTPNCTDAPLEKCSRQHDTCMIHTSWTGTLYNEMALSKSCGSSENCRDVDSNEPKCYHKENGWECQLCCHDDGCNDGANGNAPRPPPYPPVPQPLVERLTSTCVRPSNCQSQGQRLFWNEESGTVLINEMCSSPAGDIQSYNQEYIQTIQQCNIPSEPGFCVKCCSNCTNAGVRLTSYRLLPIVLMTCAFVRWLLT